MRLFIAQTKPTSMCLYNLSSGDVLLVGEGDFSFSVAFVHQMKPCVKVIASSLLTDVKLRQLHDAADSNIKFLLEKDVDVLYEVDATHLENNSKLCDKQFDRIIFNFPHVGGKSNIKKNRELVDDFFSSAVKLLVNGGDICVSFCQGQGGTPQDQPIREWHDSWQSVAAAANHGLVLREIWPFSVNDYPQYNSRGFRSLDKNFFTGGALTYVFRRCMPLDMPEIDISKPVVISEVPVHHPAMITVDGRQYTIDNSYIAQHPNRCLHQLKGHPLELMARRVRHVLSRMASQVVRELQDPSAVVRLSSDVMYAYRLIPHEQPQQRDDLRIEGNSSSGQAEEKQRGNSPEEYLDEETHCLQSDSQGIGVVKHEPNSSEADENRNPVNLPSVVDLNVLITSTEQVVGITSPLNQSKYNDGSNISASKSGATCNSGERGEQSTCNSGERDEQSTNDNDPKCDNAYLRYTMLDTIPSDCKRGVLYYGCGCVYRRDAVIDCRTMPMKQEMVVAMMEDSDHNVSHMKDLVSRVLCTVLGEDHGVIVTTTTGEPWLMTHMQSKDLHSLEVTYRSSNRLVTEACNQVSDIGKPSIPEKSTKCAQLSTQCGYVGMKHDGMVVILLYVDALCQVRYDIPDARLLWSRDPVFLEQFSGLEDDDSYVFQPLSLYPPLWRHDVSFWEDKGTPFSELNLLDVVRDIAGDTLKHVFLRNVWEEPGSGRVSRCYRLVYQSYEHSISHNMGHQLQHTVRHMLASKLLLELR